jgi:MerR family transcriptional regulator, light-induced transcriptional regulator
VGVENRFRIGELSRRTDVSPDLLRAWERRYGLLKPSRSAGGLRLYSEGDVVRVRTMLSQLEAGLAAAEAAAAAVAAPTAGEAVGDASALRRELAAALLAYDEAGAHAVLDNLMAHFSLDTVLADVVVPFLQDLGERWERGEVAVAQEHFASALLRGRLLGLARGWGAGLGPLALLACAPGEQHELGLIAFGLALRGRGWRIVYLGPDTPFESIAEAARAERPSRVVVSAVDSQALTGGRAALLELASEHPLAVGGAGSRGLDPGEDVLVLTDSPIDAADLITSIERRQRAAARTP